jgi:hypothetical protein
MADAFRVGKTMAIMTHTGHGYQLYLILSQNRFQFLGEFD